MTPPHDPQAERALLGALLIDADYCLDPVRQILPTPGAFSDLRHQLIYRAVLDLDTKREPVDMVTVSARLRSLPGDQPGRVMDCHEEAGGSAYLSDLCLVVGSAGNAPHYAGIVADLSLKRGVLRLAESLTIAATDQTTTGSEALERAEAELSALMDGAQRSSVVSLHEVAQPVLDQIRARLQGQQDGIETGYPGLDSMGGWQNKDLIILAARPSMGKTALALNVAMHTARRGDPVGFLSVEMGEESLVLRTLTYLTGFSGQAIRTRALSQQNQDRLWQVGDELGGIPLYFDFHPAPTLENARHSIRRMVTRYGVKLVFVDYLQLMSAPKAERNDLAVGALSRGLKRLAKEYSVPVVALAQLNRGCEARQDKRPMLSDLRESGQIEQDADEVLFLYRDWVYDKGADKTAAELIAAKRRNGPTGVHFLHFDGLTGRFTERANDTDERSF